MKPLEKSPFSSHFNRLVWLGGWLPETSDPKKQNFFIMYKLLLNWIALLGCSSLFLEFYYVLGDLKKAVWNLCVSILIVGASTKTLQITHRRKIINRLRLQLHRNAETKIAAEYAPIHDLALKELRFLHLFLYGSASVFLPIWLVTRYFGKNRELPVPMRFPFAVDMEDETQYACAFLLTAVSGIYGVFFGLETELSMFSIFIQLSREYRILMKDIPKLNLLYGNSEFAEEVDPMLRKSKVQTMIKELSRRQREIIQYIQTFENCYTHPLLHQFVGGSALIILLGLQCMIENVDVLGSLMYQLGYLSALTVNLFMICWFSTKLKILCLEVGDVTYSTCWYNMELDTRRDLIMMILRSQNPPKLTSGGLMELNVNAFMQSMSHIVSWLLLLRELQVNVVPKTSP